MTRIPTTEPILVHVRGGTDHTLYRLGKQNVSTRATHCPFDATLFEGCLALDLLALTLHVRVPPLADPRLELVVPSEDEDDSLSHCF